MENAGPFNQGTESDVCINLLKGKSNKITKRSIVIAITLVIFVTGSEIYSLSTKDQAVSSKTIIPYGGFNVTMETPMGDIVIEGNFAEIVLHLFSEYLPILEIVVSIMVGTSLVALLVFLIASLSRTAPSPGRTIKIGFIAFIVLRVTPFLLPLSAMVQDVSVDVAVTMYWIDVKDTPPVKILKKLAKRGLLWYSKLVIAYAAARSIAPVIFGILVSFHATRKRRHIIDSYIPLLLIAAILIQIMGDSVFTGAVLSFAAAITAPLFSTCAHINRDIPKGRITRYTSITSAIASITLIAVWFYRGGVECIMGHSSPDFGSVLSMIATAIMSWFIGSLIF